MKQLTYILISICVLFFSCKKEEIELPMQQITLGTSQSIYDIDFVSENVGYAVGGTKWESSIILKTIDGGLSWTLDESIDAQGFFGVDFLTEDIGYTTGYGGKILKTENGGSHWDVFQDNSYGTFKDVSAIDMDNIVVVGEEEGDSGVILISQNNWWEMTSHILQDDIEKVLFFSNTEGFILGNGYVRKTEDGGQSWWQGEPKNDRFVGIDFPTSDIGFVCGFQGSIWQTIDRGLSWDELEKNNKIFTKRVHFTDIDFYDENLGMVVGHDGAVYITRDGGSDWKKVKMDSNITLKAVSFVDANTVVVAGLDGKMWHILV